MMYPGVSVSYSGVTQGGVLGIISYQRNNTCMFIPFIGVQNTFYSVVIQKL